MVSQNTLGERIPYYYKGRVLTRTRILSGKINACAYLKARSRYAVAKNIISEVPESFAKQLLFVYTE